MDQTKDLIRFLRAQNQMYLKAVAEIEKGKKESDWMAFIFPQIAGTQLIESQKRYGILDLDEAATYLAHPVLGKHLVEIATKLMAADKKNIFDIFTASDAMKIQASMTLFKNVKNADPIFSEILQKYFHGIEEPQTRLLLD